MSSSTPSNAPLERAGTESALGRSDERPLSEGEQQLLTRLLSDPFSIPQPFKTWIISYIESSDMTLPISSIQGLSSRLPPP